MVEIPLILRLKKQAHKDIAKAQDMVVKELYNVFDKAVLHGGIAIWRCYDGNRFSEDVDAYIPKDEERIDVLFRILKERGFIIKKKKIGENSLFSSLELDEAVVRFEALFKKPIPKGSLEEYKTVDGNLVTVYVLLPEEIIKEKVDAYLTRQKIRDLYDIFFLLRNVKDKKPVFKELRRLITQFKNPVDEKELKVLIIEGLVPDIGNILEYIKRWL